MARRLPGLSGCVGVLALPATLARSTPKENCSPSFRDGPDPESRDSGFDAAHRPGMTVRGEEKGMSNPLYGGPATCEQTLRALARYPSRTAFSWPGGSLTYSGATDLIGRIQSIF